MDKNQTKTVARNGRCQGCNLATGGECFAILFRDTILTHEKQSNFLVVSEKSCSFVS